MSQKGFKKERKKVNRLYLDMATEQMDVARRIEHTDAAELQAAMSEIFKRRADMFREFGETVMKITDEDMVGFVNTVQLVYAGTDFYTAGILNMLGFYDDFMAAKKKERGGK